MGWTLCRSSVNDSSWLYRSATPWPNERYAGGSARVLGCGVAREPGADGLAGGVDGDGDVGQALDDGVAEAAAVAGVLPGGQVGGAVTQVDGEAYAVPRQRQRDRGAGVLLGVGGQFRDGEYGVVHEVVELPGG